MKRRDVYNSQKLFETTMAKKIKYTEEDLKNHDAVAVIIKDQSGRILIQNHAKYGFWTIPIGKVKSGQTCKEGMKEEVFEECNLILEKFDEIGSREYVYERDGKMVKLTLHLYETTKYSGELSNKEPHKHKEQLFMPLAEIKKIPYLSDSTLLFLELRGYKRKANLE